MSRTVFPAFLACALLAVLPSAAQEPAPAPPADAVPRTHADETFDLDISDRRITEEDFEASTVVELRPERHRISLRIGALVRAERIDVRLREVHGRVRFFATLDRVLERIEAHRAPSAP